VSATADKLDNIDDLALSHDRGFFTKVNIMVQWMRNSKPNVYTNVYGKCHAVHPETGTAVCGRLDWERFRLGSDLVVVLESVEGVDREDFCYFCQRWVGLREEEIEERERIARGDNTDEEAVIRADNLAKGESVPKSAHVHDDTADRVTALEASLQAKTARIARIEALIAETMLQNKRIKAAALLEKTEKDEQRPLFTTEELEKLRRAVENAYVHAEYQFNDEKQCGRNAGKVVKLESEVRSLASLLKKMN
jgi:hypothetical protein